MSAQPLAPPDVDLEILQALDFEPDYPCEMLLPSTGSECGAPASLLIVSRSPCACPKKPFPICADCWVRIARNDDQPSTCWHCGDCRTHIAFTRDETFLVVCHLKGGKS